jgi:hypothetical protein
MNKWVTRGRVHVRGELQAREYLLRDVVLRLAMACQRRQFTKVNRLERGAAEAHDPEAGRP